MDTWGIVICIAGLVLYYVTKKQVFFLWLSGVGAGIVVGAVWAMQIINNILP